MLYRLYGDYPEPPLVITPLGSNTSLFCLNLFFLSVENLIPSYSLVFPLLSNRSTFHPSGPQSGCFWCVNLSCRGWNKEPDFPGVRVVQNTKSTSEHFKFFKIVFNCFKMSHESEYQNTNSSYNFQGFSIIFLQFFTVSLLDRFNMSCCCLAASSSSSISWDLWARPCIESTLV